MSSCDRCTNLNRLLTDERKDHEETRKALKRAQTAHKRRGVRLKELEAIFEWAVDINPLIAARVASISAEKRSCERGRAAAKSAQRKVDNRGTWR